jgi:hypothetical protein
MFHRLAFNLVTSSLSLPGAGIAGMTQRVQLIYNLFSLTYLGRNEDEVQKFFSVEDICKCRSL